MWICASLFRFQSSDKINSLSSCCKLLFIAQTCRYIIVYEIINSFPLDLATWVVEDLPQMQMNGVISVSVGEKCHMWWMSRIKNGKWLQVYTPWVKRRRPRWWFQDIERQKGTKHSLRCTHAYAFTVTYTVDERVEQVEAVAHCFEADRHPVWSRNEALCNKAIANKLTHTHTQST